MSAPVLIIHMQAELPHWISFDSSSFKKSAILVGEQKKEKHEQNPNLVCRYKITAKSEAISVAGRHVHEFINPHEIKFRIGCFRTAVGCVQVGHLTEE